MWNRIDLMKENIANLKIDLAKMKTELAEMEKQLIIAKKNNPDEAKLLEIGVQALRESIYSNEEMLKDMEDEISKN